MATAEDNLTLRLASSVYDGSDLPRVRFVARVAEHGYTHLAHDSFRGAIDAASVAELGVPELIRSSARSGALQALVWLHDGTLCLLDAGNGAVAAEVAGDDAEALVAAIAGVRERVDQPEQRRSTLPFRFWSAEPGGGGDVRYRDLDVTTWAAARANYTARVAGALDALMAVREPRRGRLLIWRGAPGTGKTWALRALADAWRDWCPPHYVLDPHRLMGADPRYLLDVLAWSDDNAWRLLVLEDAGDLVVHDAGRTGALAALLNVTDGLLGHGTGTIVLVTTNEPVEHLHPAVRRRGRCLADIEFGPLTCDEARAWLRHAGCDHEPDGPLTLAELYAIVDGGDPGDEPLPAAARFGFSRALGG